MLAVISGNNKVNTSVNANNIADVRDIAFFDIIGNRDGKNIQTSYLNATGNIRYFGQMVILPVV